MRCSSVGRGIGLAVLAAVLLTAASLDRLTAQGGGGVAGLAVRLASMTAITGYEQAMGDSLLALLPGSERDRLGDVTLVRGTGAPRRLATCALDEVGYVVGGVTDAGYLTLRRVGARFSYALFDQQLEGQRVTVFGTRGAVPGVVAVRSVHLTRGRAAVDAPFTVDNAYVDVGATSRAEAEALGIAVLAPVARAKRPMLYGNRLLAAPVAGRRAACAALAAAALARPHVRGTVVVAFTVQSLYAGNAGLAAVKALRGPFEEIKEATLTSRYPDTVVETVSLAEAEALEQQLVSWMEGK